MDSYSPLAAYSGRKSLVGGLLLLFGLPVVVVAIYALIFSLGSPGRTWPSLLFFVFLAVILLCFSLVYYFLFRVFVHRFFAGLAKVGIQKKKGQKALDEELLAFRLFEVAHEELIVQELKEQHEKKMKSAAGQFSRQAGFWKLGKSSHFFFPVADSVSEQKVKLFKAPKHRIDSSDCGVVGFIVERESLEYNSERDLFELFSGINSVLSDIADKYGGFLYSSNGSTAGVLFAGEWERQQKAVRAIKAGREIYTQIKKSMPDIIFGVAVDVVAGREGFISYGSVMRYFFENSFFQLLRVSSGAKVHAGLQLSSRVVELVKQGRANSV